MDSETTDCGDDNDREHCNLADFRDDFFVFFVRCFIHRRVSRSRHVGEYTDCLFVEQRTEALGVRRGHINGVVALLIGFGSENVVLRRGEDHSVMGSLVFEFVVFDYLDRCPLVGLGGGHEREVDYAVTAVILEVSGLSIGVDAIEARELRLCEEVGEDCSGRI